MIRKSSPRLVALIQGATAEFGMGLTLYLWLASPYAAGRAPFGPVAARAMLITAMVALVLVMLVLVLAARWGKVALRTCVMAASPAVAGVGALMIGALFSHPAAAILLAQAWIFSVLVVVTVARASAQLGREDIPRQERS